MQELWGKEDQERVINKSINGLIVGDTPEEALQNALQHVYGDDDLSKARVAKLFEQHGDIATIANTYLTEANTPTFEELREQLLSNPIDLIFCPLTADEKTRLLERFRTVN